MKEKELIPDDIHPRVSVSFRRVLISSPHEQKLFSLVIRQDRKWCGKGVSNLGFKSFAGDLQGQKLFF